MQIHHATHPYSLVFFLLWRKSLFKADTSKGIDVEIRGQIVLYRNPMTASVIDLATVVEN